MEENAKRKRARSNSKYFVCNYVFLGVVCLAVFYLLELSYDGLLYESFLFFFLVFSFVGCECPEGWTGSHRQNAVDTAATDDMLQAATSKTSIGRVMGFLVLSVFAATLLLMFCGSSKKKKEKKKCRVDAKSGRSYRDRQQAHAGGEMA
jgi:hypothetical protein